MVLHPSSSNVKMTAKAILRGDTVHALVIPLVADLKTKQTNKKAPLRMELKVSNVYFLSQLSFAFHPGPEGMEAAGV